VEANRQEKSMTDQPNHDQTTTGTETLERPERQASSGGTNAGAETPPGAEIETPEGLLRKRTGRALKGLVFLGILLTGFLQPDTGVVIVFLLFAFALWNGILYLVVRRSRFVGGIVLIVYSALFLAVGGIASWVGIYGVLLFAQGTWLSLVGAARLDV